MLFSKVMLFSKKVLVMGLTAKVLGVVAITPNASGVATTFATSTIAEFTSGVLPNVLPSGVISLVPALASGAVHPDEDQWVSQPYLPFCSVINVQTCERNGFTYVCRGVTLGYSGNGGLWPECKSTTYGGYCYCRYTPQFIPYGSS